MKTLTLACDDLTPVRAFAALRAATKSACFLFESVVGGERWGRYSILAYEPNYELSLFKDGWKVHGKRPVFAAEIEKSQHAFDAAKVLARSPIDLASASPLTLAEQIAQSHLGYFSWETVSAITKVERFGGDEKVPLARLFGESTVVVFDALDQTLTLAAESDEAITRACSILDSAPRLSPIAIPNRSKIPNNVRVLTSDEDYCQNVVRAKEYITAGDAFQIVVARTFTVPALGRDPFAVYRAMRLINPSPYMYFLDMPRLDVESERVQILGASPETLVKLERSQNKVDRVMTLRPLAGTRKRGENADEDKKLEAELLADPKERAEHVMLIDLGRNDVGRVAKTGSVRLVRNMEIERYSHVMHLVSEVQGTITNETSSLDVLRSAFPAGTLSGAPKLRAMQIIHELEGRPRGIYGGAVGYLGDELDFAIAIRTAICQNGIFEVTAGAGIVEGSVPMTEAEETRSKARGVLAAIEAAKQG